MKIDRDAPLRMTIETFADRHGLVMQISERSQRLVDELALRPFYAHFKNTHIAERGFLRGTSGDGWTEGEAIADYRRAISGRRLKHNAGYYLDVPELLPSP